MQSTTGALRKRRPRNRASVFTAFVNEVLDLRAAQGNALAQFAYIRDGFGRGLFPWARGWFLLGEGFEGAGDDLLGRLVAAGAKMLGDELFAVRIEG